MGIAYKYFQISHDSSIANSPSIIHKTSIGVRNEPKEEAKQIFVKDAPKIEYTDFLENPFFLISNTFKKTVEMYNPDFDYKAVVLSEKISGKQTLYWHINLPHVHCFPEVIRQTKSIVKAKTLDRSRIYISKVKDLSLFKFHEAAATIPFYIIRLDLAESILRRGVVGFTLKGLEDA